MALDRSKEALTRLTKSENAIIRATVDVGHVADGMFVCIGGCFGNWFIGIRKLPWFICIRQAS